MRNRNPVFLPALFILLLALMMTAGCGAPKTPAKETMELADGRGEMITLTKNPKRVIIIDPAICDIFYAIGAQDSIVAVGSYCEYPAEVAAKPKVGAYADLNVEELVALQPDLILFGTMSTDEAKLGSLKSAGIEVIGIGMDTLALTYHGIEKMGVLMGKEAEAKRVASDMKKALDELFELASKTAAQAETKKVYIEISPLMFGLYTCGTGTFQDELINLVGAENIFGDEQDWPAVSEEQIIQLNPDIIISTTQYDGYDPIAEIASRAGWENITAVQNGDIFFLDPSVVSLASPRLVLGAEQLYQVVYGE